MNDLEAKYYAYKQKATAEQNSKVAYAAKVEAEERMELANSNLAKAVAAQ